MRAAPDAPIGVFDSGVGGLSVLRALRAELPHERFVYLADTGHAPYGERGDAYVAARTHAITDYLRRQHGIKALVVACNTATAAAIHEVRARHPELPVIGVEPALKPAVAATRTGRIGVMATRGTLASAKFMRLLASLQGQAEFVVQPCPGLALAIEHSALPGAPGAATAAQVELRCIEAVSAMGRFGAQPGQIDTLVLGCTHYVFAETVLRRLVGPRVQLVETGVPVARQAQRLLQRDGLLAPATARPGLALRTTGDAQALLFAASRWLADDAGAAQVVDIPPQGSTQGARE